MCVVMRKIRKQILEMGQVQTGVKEPQINYVDYTWSTCSFVNDTNNPGGYLLTDA